MRAIALRLLLEIRESNQDRFKVSIHAISGRTAFERTVLVKFAIHRPTVLYWWLVEEGILHIVL